MNITKENAQKYKYIFYTFKNLIQIIATAVIIAIAIRPTNRQITLSDMANNVDNAINSGNITTSTLSDVVGLTIGCLFVLFAVYHVADAVRRNRKNPVGLASVLIGALFGTLITINNTILIIAIVIMLLLASYCKAYEDETADYMTYSSLDDTIRVRQNGEIATYVRRKDDETPEPKEQVVDNDK